MGFYEEFNNEVKEFHNKSITELLIVIIMMIVEITTMIFSVIVSIEITHQVTLTFSSFMQFFEDAPALYWYIILIIFTVVWFITLILPLTLMEYRVPLYRKIVKIMDAEK